MDDKPCCKDMVDCNCSIAANLVSQVKNMGRAENIIIELLDEDLFKNLSKHNTYWHHKDDEVEEKFDNIRMKISCLHDNLWGVVDLLRRGDCLE